MNLKNIFLKKFNIIKQKPILEIILYIIIFILSLYLIYLFYYISNNLSTPNLNTKYFSGKKFTDFIFNYKFPLYLIAIAVSIISILIAFLRFQQHDKLLKITKQSFDADYRPFITNKKIEYFKKKHNDSYRLYLKLFCVNFGKFPAKINRIHLTFIEPTKDGFNALYYDLYIILPEKEPSKIDQCMHKNYKDEIDVWIKNKVDIKVLINIDYQGLNDFFYSTKEMWLLSHKDKEKKFKIIDSEWK